MKHFLKNLRRDTRGNALAIFAAALIPLIVVIGSGLDLSIAYMAKARLQNACDAAVLAGRQSMEGSRWTKGDEKEADKFFAFNFPEGTLGTTDLDFEVDQDPDDVAQVVGNASASVMTSLMFIFGYDEIPIAAHCDAKRDLGHNDIMLVLDVTGSMYAPPKIGGDLKIDRLRKATLGLYRALEDSSGDSITRFGLLPYSQTVNVGRSLEDRDILDDQLYSKGYYSWTECDANGQMRTNCVSDGIRYPTRLAVPYTGYNGSLTKYATATFVYEGEQIVPIAGSSWSLGKSVNADRQAFRTSGVACIEERSTIGNGSNPIEIEDDLTADDIDLRAQNDSDDSRQFGRYDPAVQQGQAGSSCPSEAIKLQQYGSEAAYESAVDAATEHVGGNTYHDIGMLWGLRFISRTGFFASDNPAAIKGVPVNQHIVFMTDGMLQTSGTLYTAYGIDDYQQRVAGGGTRDERHIARFDAVCDLAKARGITVWVIAFDVDNTDDIEGCATSASHFYTTDGSNLEDIFSGIGKAIGSLRLTR